MRHGGHCGFIDETGEVVIKPQSEDGTQSGEPFEKLMEENEVKYGYIDRAGQYMWPPAK